MARNIIKLKHLQNSFKFVRRDLQLHYLTTIQVSAYMHNKAMSLCALQTHSVAVDNSTQGDLNPNKQTI